MILIIILMKRIDYFYHQVQVEKKEILYIYVMIKIFVVIPFLLKIL